VILLFFSRTSFFPAAVVEPETGAFDSAACFAV